jgi:hypothetical protein
MLFFCEEQLCNAAQCGEMLMSTFWVANARSEICCYTVLHVCMLGHEFVVVIIVVHAGTCPVLSFADAVVMSS